MAHPDPDLRRRGGVTIVAGEDHQVAVYRLNLSRASKAVMVYHDRDEQDCAIRLLAELVQNLMDWLPASANPLERWLAFRQKMLIEQGTRITLLDNDDMACAEMVLHRGTVHMIQIGQGMLDCADVLPTGASGKGGADGGKHGMGLKQVLAVTAAHASQGWGLTLAGSLPEESGTYAFLRSANLGEDQFGAEGGVISSCDLGMFSEKVHRRTDVVGVPFLTHTCRFWDSTKSDDWIWAALLTSHVALRHTGALLRWSLLMGPHVPTDTTRAPNASLSATLEDDAVLFLAFPEDKQSCLYVNGQFAMRHVLLGVPDMLLLTSKTMSDPYRTEYPDLLRIYGEQTELQLERCVMAPTFLADVMDKTFANQPTPLLRWLVTQPVALEWLAQLCSLFTVKHAVLQALPGGRRLLRRLRRRLAAGAVGGLIGYEMTHGVDVWEKRQVPRPRSLPPLSQLAEDVLPTVLTRWMFDQPSYQQGDEFGDGEVCYLGDQIQAQTPACYMVRQLLRQHRY